MQTNRTSRRTGQKEAARWSVIALLLLPLTAVLSLPLGSHSQTPKSKPTFDVVSVKRNKSGSQTTSQGVQGCRFVATNATLEMMLSFAYRFADGRIVPRNRTFGGPGWMAAERFDLEAKPVPGTDALPYETYLLMVQAVLEDRFRLKTHWERRDLPVYDLVVAKGGVKMKESPLIPRPSPQGNLMLPCSRPLIPPVPPLPPTAPRGATASRVPLRIQYPIPGSVSITANGLSIATLLNFIGGYVDRPIINKTNLTGGYDFKLTFSGQTALTQSQNPSVEAAVSDPTGPSLFTAIQDLGLKFESTRVPLEVFVIDSAERPSEN